DILDGGEKKLAGFYRQNRIPEEMEKALNRLFFKQPEDVHGYLASYFTKLSAAPRINRLNGRKVYDTRGQLSVEVEVFCIICNEEQNVCSASVSSCFGSNEYSVDWKPNCQERAEHVKTAIEWINEPLNDMLKGYNPCDQSQIDHLLSKFFMTQYLEWKDILQRKEEEKIYGSGESDDGCPPPTAAAPTKEKRGDTKKTTSIEKALPPTEPTEPVVPGSLGIGSVSLAVAKAGAKVQGIPLYKHIASLKTQETPAQLHIPICLVTLMSCGKGSPGKLRLMEEVILIPKAGQSVTELQKEMMKIMNASTKAGAVMHDSGAPILGFERAEQPLELVAEASANLGLALGAEIYLAVNCAAAELMDHSKGKYEVATGMFKSPDELLDLYQSLINKFPALVALINPFRKEDNEQWEKLRNANTDSCSLLFEGKAPPPPAVRGYVVKHIHDTTVSDLVHFASEKQGNRLTDSELQHCVLPPQAVGLGLDYIKLGGLIGAERMTKYNRLLSIEEELAQRGAQGGMTTRLTVWSQKHAALDSASSTPPFPPSFGPTSGVPRHIAGERTEWRSAQRWRQEQTHTHRAVAVIQLVGTGHIAG
uniref:Enolase 4 n=1 Tax=Cynoglossus semilaevis TaxID=244447 RepID=A0A3P8WLT8_CYNSE